SVLDRELTGFVLAIVPAAPKDVGVLKLDKVRVESLLGHVVDELDGVLDGRAALDTYPAIAVAGRFVDVIAVGPNHDRFRQDLAVRSHADPAATQGLQVGVSRKQHAARIGT